MLMFLLRSVQALDLFYFLLKMVSVVWFTLCYLILCWFTVPVLFFSFCKTGFLYWAVKNPVLIPIFFWPIQFTRGQSNCRGLILVSR